MTGRIFNGKQYKRFTSYPSKKSALNFAKENRRGDWNARVVKEGDEWAVYLRNKLR